MRIPVGEGAQVAENRRLAREWRDREEAEVRRSRGRDPEALWRECMASLSALPAVEQVRLRRAWSGELLAGVEAPLPLCEAWGAWLASPSRRECAEPTLRQYEAEWRRFAAWAGGRGLRSIADVRPADAWAYAQDLGVARYSSGSYNAHLRGLRLVWAGLRHRRGGQPDPWEDIPLRRVRREGRRTLTIEELTRLLSAADGEDRVLLSLGLYTALRLGDCVRLTWAQVDMESGWMELVPHKTSTTSGRSVRISLHPALGEVLRAWRAGQRGGEERVVPLSWSAYSMDPSSVSARIGQLFRDAGIQTTEDAPAGAARRRRVARAGFHSLRHAFASLAEVSGPGSLAVLQELLGHGAESTTRLYLHAGDEARRRVVSSLPAVG
jgi:integrase